MLTLSCFAANAIFARAAASLGHATAIVLDEAGTRVTRSRALPTAPSARSGIPIKHISENEDDGPPPLVREGGGFIFTDRSAVALERMERMHSAGPPLICSQHVQGLGRGKGPPKAVQVKAVKAAPPQAVPPIPELDLKVLISSKVSPPPHPPHSSSLTLPSTAESWPPPPPHASGQGYAPQGISRPSIHPCLQYMTREPQADFSRAGHRYAALVVRRKHTVHHVMLSTRFSELTPSARHPRRMLAIPTSGGHRHELRSIEKARTRRNRFPESNRCAPAFCDFSRNFVYLLMFFRHPVKPI